jgi:general secretion pathway protein J
MINQHHYKQSSQGFTLIEVIIAIAIFAIIATMVIGGLKAVLTANQITSVDADQLAQLQLAMLIMERDVEQMTDRPITDQNGQVQVAVIASPQYLEFTHGGYSNPFGLQNRSTLQRVAYTIQNGQLIRTTWPELDRAPTTQAINHVLLSNITSIQFQMMDNNQQFYDSWPPPNSVQSTSSQTSSNSSQNTATTTAVGTTNTTNQNNTDQYNANQSPVLPTAIKVVLTLGNGGTITRFFAIPGKSLETTTTSS